MQDIALVLDKRVQLVLLIVVSLIVVMVVWEGVRHIPRARRFVLTALNFAINIFSSLRHNYGHYISDIFFVSLSVYLGYKLEKVLSGSHSLLFYGVALLLFTGKILSYRRYSISSGRAFRSFFHRRLGAARAIARYNVHLPAEIKPGRHYSTEPIVLEIMDEFLSGHLDFLHRTLKLGFTLRGRDTYSASILLFDSTTERWHKWQTFYASDSDQPRPGSVWPIPRSRFVFDDTMYVRDRHKPYHISEINNEFYKSILAIPFYFKHDQVNGPNGMERKDNIYALLSYTNTVPHTFRNIEADTFAKFFALEASIIERIALHIYRSYNF